jgi:6-phosphogluconolactonase (cycloisomerase 2 family)
MLDRRHVTALLGATLGSTLSLPARAGEDAPAFYSGVGRELSWYAFDSRTGALTRGGSVTLPANVQYAWPDPARRFLYVTASFNKVGAVVADAGGHCVRAFQVGADGALSAQGPALPLKHRPIHNTVSPDGRFLVIAYNVPSGITVHPINADGTVGAEIPQSPLDTGIYAHQVRLTPDGKTLALVTRGNDAVPGHAEDPGALKIFRFADGKLSNLQSLAPHGQGLGFGPRHLDFGGTHVFVSLERENSLCVYGLNPDGSFSAEPLFLKSALTDPDAKSKYPGQTSGPVHVHPSGRFVYQTNRGSMTNEVGGKAVWNGGLNDIAVWRIDPASGNPVRIQNIDAHGFEIRTFSITPDGKWLVAASQLGLDVAEGSAVKHVSAGLAVYRIQADGKLDFARKLDVDTSAGTQFWSGFLTMT